MAGRTLRILCFGDSLTSGYTRYGLISHPYEEKLAEELQGAVPNLVVDTTEDGRPGDLTSNFMQRITKHFGPRKPKYDWTIILGGTNDLAYMIPPEAIFENLQRCWTFALLKGSKVLALTVPEVGIRGKHDQRRDRLNELIRGAQDGDIYVHDHKVAVPFWSMSQEDRKLYWDDTVHLTSAGYGLMGEMIAARLVDILAELDEKESVSKRGEKAAAASAAAAEQNATKQTAKETPSEDKPSRPSRKKPFTDDNNVFDEESGDPTKIRQGYVVVRKKDLD